MNRERLEFLNLILDLQSKRAELESKESLIGRQIGAVDVVEHPDGSLEWSWDSDFAIISWELLLHPGQIAMRWEGETLDGKMYLGPYHVEPLGVFGHGLLVKKR